MDVFQTTILIFSAIWAAVFVVQKILASHWGQVNPDEEEDARMKTVLITGAGSGVGFETAVEMASRGATVIITGRTNKAVHKTVEAIRNRTFLGKLISMQLELGSLNSVRGFCEDVKKTVERIDILINNAGVLIPPTKRQKTTDGFEIHFGVNHLSHFLLTTSLLPLLQKSDSGRVVVLTSWAHRGSKLNFDDLMFERTEIPKATSASDNPIYSCSKLANILFASELAKRLEGTNVHVNACCPGLVKTNISRSLDLPWYAKLVMPMLDFIFKTPNQGCQTVLHCALSKKCNHDSGNLYRNCKPWNTVDTTYAFPDDWIVPWVKTVYPDEDGHKLWIESERLCLQKGL